MVTDAAEHALRRRFEIVLPVARGRADMLSMHAATLALVETLLVGVAALRPRETLTSLDRLNTLRERLAGAALELSGAADPPGR